MIQPLKSPGDRLRVRIEGDSLRLIDFLAPVGSDTAARAWVILSVVASESTFLHFNPAADDDLTQRTTLLSIVGDSVVVVTSSRPGGPAAARNAARNAPTPALPALDEPYRKQVLAHRSAPSHGIGRGLYGTTVVFARAPVPGTPWLLVRERDVDELLSLLSTSLRITDAVFALLAMLIMGVTATLWRAAHLRRESDAMRLRSAFVSSVSHELRTPLTQIRMYAEMLRLGLMGGPEDSARALGVIEKEAERLSMLVERSLSVVRSESSAPPPTATIVNVADSARAALAVMTPIAAERDARIVVDVPDAVGACIERGALHQVLLNLLDNAIKYGPRGQTIRLSAATAGPTARLVVEDDGPGIPRDEREQVWREFVRGRNVLDNPQPGSGIGLAVVRDLVQQARGRAWVETRDDGEIGSRFVIELPAQVLTRQAAVRTET
jgi:signal transduction histidine kinase